MTLGERLKNLRQDAGLTQEELAQKVGLKKQNISRYENSHCEPNIRTAKKIADALGVTIEEMAVGVSIPSAPTPDLTKDEMNLVAAWRIADEKDRRIVATALEDYGFSYTQDAENTNAG